MSTYRGSGVDLDAAERLVATIAPVVTETWHDGVVGGFGGFAAGITLPPGFEDPVLMMSTDGVGTKAELARRTGLLDGLGWDLVAMCIDDLAAAGARPIALTDYLAVGKLRVGEAERLVRSIAAACAEAGVALLGGETAEHPGVMGAGEFDMAGTALGVVERGKEVDGSDIATGDVLIGIDSPNLRSNGFSLVRAALGEADLTAPLPGSERPTAEALLEPSVLYTPLVLRVIDEVPVSGLAHITGGGLCGNVARVLPPEMDAVMDAGAWTPPVVFSAIAGLANIADTEMFGTFNMGIGFVIVTRPEHAGEVVAAAEERGRSAYVIGEITEGARHARLVGV